MHLMSILIATPEELYSYVWEIWLKSAASHSVMRYPWTPRCLGWDVCRLSYLVRWGLHPTPHFLRLSQTPLSHIKFSSRVSLRYL